MDQIGSYAHFSMVKDSLFTINYGIRPKYQFNKPDKLSKYSSFISVCVCLFIVVAQAYVFVSLDNNFLRCSTPFSCAVYYVSMPLNALSDISVYAHFTVVICAFLLSFITFLFFIISAANVQKKDLNMARFCFIKYVYIIFFNIYLIDMLTLGLRSFPCHFFKFHYYASRNGTNDTETCSSSWYYGLVVVSALMLFHTCILAQVITAMSPYLDFRRLKGKIASVRVDLYINVAKCMIAILAVIVDSLEHKSWTETVYRHDIRAAVFGVETLIFLFISIYFVLQSPCTTDLFNRLRTGGIGSVCGMSLICCVEQICYLVQNDKTGFNGNLRYYMAVSGAIGGCLCFVLAPLRKRHLSNMLEDDMNMLSAVSESELDAYGTFLRTFILTEDEPAEFLNVTSSTSVSSVDQIILQCLKSANNNKQNGSDEPDTITQLNNIVSTDSKLNKSNNGSNSILKNEALKVEENNHVNQPNDNINQSSKTPHEQIDSSFNTNINIILSQSPKNKQKYRNNTPTTSQTFFPSISPSGSEVGGTNDKEDVNNNNQASNPSDAITCLTCPLLEIYRNRLALYMKSQNFSAIHRSLNLNADMELTLRTIATDWEELSDAQKKIARISVLQLYAALYVRSSGGLNESCPASYFLWFAASCLTMWTDVILAMHSIQIACECDTSMYLDDSYFCFLMQKTCEEIQSGDANNHKRASGVTDLAAFHRLASSAHILHEKALNALKKFFKSGVANLRISVSEEAHLAKKTTVTSKDLKATRDAKKLLKQALSLIKQAEDSYASLLQRYSTVPIVHTFVSSFKRQLFRDESLSSSENPSNNSAFIPISAMSNTNTTKANSTLEGLSKKKVNSGPTTTTSFGLDGSSSDESSGQGLLSETPKVAKLLHVEETVKRTFNVLRVVALICLLVVLAVVIFFTIMTMIQLRKVNEWLNALSVTSDVFDLLPFTCNVFSRAIVGLAFMHKNFFSNAQTYVETAANSIIARSSVAYDAAADLTDCQTLLTTMPDAFSCVIAYADGSSSSLSADLSTGIIYDNSASLGSAFLSATLDENDNYYWWAKTQNLLSVNSLSVSDIHSIQGIQKMNSEPLYRFYGWPLFYVTPGAAAGTAASFQGAIYVFSQTVPNDLYALWYTKALPNLTDSLQTNSNNFINTVTNLNVVPIVQTLSEPFYELGSYPDVGDPYYTPRTFVEMLSILTTDLTTLSTLIELNFDYVSVYSSGEFKTVFELCSSESIRDSSIIISSFISYLHHIVNNSVLIVTLCAAAALIATFVGAMVTLRLVRVSLKEFDRSDGVPAFLAVFAALPRVEIKRFSRNIHHLKVDQGIIDPDDEKAGFVDPSEKRRIIGRVYARHLEAGLDILDGNNNDGHNFDRKNYHSPKNASGGNGVSFKDENDFDSPVGHSLRHEQHDDEVGSLSQGFDLDGRNGHLKTQNDLHSRFEAHEFHEIDHRHHDFSSEEDETSNDDDGQNGIIANKKLTIEHNSINPSFISHDDENNNNTFNDFSSIQLLSPSNNDHNGSFNGQQSKKKIKYRVVLKGVLENPPQPAISSFSPYSDKPASSLQIKVPPRPHSTVQNTSTMDLSPIGSTGGGMKCTSSVGETESTTSSTSGWNSRFCDFFMRIISLNGILYRTMSRQFIVLWLLMFIYVIIAMVLARKAVFGFFQYYEDIATLLTTSYNLSIIAQNAPQMDIGIVSATGVTPELNFRSTNFDDYYGWFSESLTASRSLFFDLIDRKDGSWSVGRKISSRDAILYDPGCYSESIDISCTTSERSAYNSYYKMSRTQYGLVRSYVTYFNLASSFMLNKADGVNNVPDASDVNTWWFVDSLRIDIKPGFLALVDTFEQEALDDVDKEMNIQNMILGVGIGLFVIIGIFFEILVRYQLSIFRHTILVLRIFPNRYLEDFRIIETVLNVKSDDDSEII